MVQLPLYCFFSSVMYFITLVLGVWLTYIRLYIRIMKWIYQYVFCKCKVNLLMLNLNITFKNAHSLCVLVLYLKDIYLKEMNELTIMDYDSEDEDALSPNKLFTVYNEDYKNAYVQAKSINGERIHIIDLFPKESGPIMKIRLTINALKNQISILALYDKTGGVYTYNIKSFKADLDVIPFNFDATNYPEVEVIDLR